MVRLKEEMFLSPRPFLDISIPVWCDWRPFTRSKYVRPSVFQFQYGAIEGSKFRLWCFLKFYFNSSMVRLKGRMVSFASRHWRHFNSSMVRLKASVHRDKTASLIFQFQYGAIEGSNPEIEKVSVVLFQFQYGAIEGRYRSSDQLINFISIPVWCDWRKLTMVIHLRLLDFNSSMVRLKVFEHHFESLLKQHFNSSMVRLKVTQRYRESGNNTISIPVWCDWRQANRSESKEWAQISIPVWCDWRTWQALM